MRLKDVEHPAYHTEYKGIGDAISDNSAQSGIAVTVPSHLELRCVVFNHPERWTSGKIFGQIVGLKVELEHGELPERIYHVQDLFARKRRRRRWEAFCAQGFHSRSDCHDGRLHTVYSDAMRSEWEGERQVFAERAAFQEKFAKGFEASAENARGVSQRLGAVGRVGPEHRATARRAHEEADHARYLANSTFVKVTEARCVSAGNMPGQNCEISFIVRGVDGKDDERVGAYRLDKRGGSWAVVGPASGS